MGLMKEQITKIKETEPKKIDNTIQNLIQRDEDNPSLENQKIKVSTQKAKMAKEKTSYYLFSHTKASTSHY